MKEVRSVSEYVSHVETFRPTLPSQQFLGCFTFFRGQSNIEWSLAPSLYRQGLFQEEQLLIQYLHHSCPDEFTSNKFETLVKLQHFGLPTRLLDTSTNPLVALFFACDSEEQKKNDGVVFVFPNLPVLWSNDPLIQLVMEHVFNHANNRFDLSKVLSNCNEISSHSFPRLTINNKNDLIRCLTVPSIAVMPEKTNRRILAQDGAFFLCGMKITSKENSNNPGNIGTEYYSFGPVDLTDNKTLWDKAEKIIIPSSAKDDIINQLDIMGINEAKLFPDLSHQAKHAVKYVRYNRTFFPT